MLLDATQSLKGLEVQQAVCELRVASSVVATVQNSSNLLDKYSGSGSN